MKKISENPYKQEDSLKDSWQQGYSDAYHRKTELPLTKAEAFAYGQGQKAYTCDLHDVPSGYYCYKIVGEFKNNRLPTKVCPYLKYEDRTFENQTERVSVCSLLTQNESSEDPYFGIVMDQVKECGENMDDPDEEVVVS